MGRVGGGVSWLRVIRGSCQNKCKRPAYINRFKLPGKRHVIIGVRQRDADGGLGSSGTLEPAGGIRQAIS